MHTVVRMRSQVTLVTGGVHPWVSSPRPKLLLAPDDSSCAAIMYTMYYDRWLGYIAASPMTIRNLLYCVEGWDPGRSRRECFTVKRGEGGGRSAQVPPMRYGTHIYSIHKQLARSGKWLASLEAISGVSFRPAILARCVCVRARSERMGIIGYAVSICGQLLSQLESSAHLGRHGTRFCANHRALFRPPENLALF